MPPDFVVIGHVTRDETPQGVVLGGTVTYTAITARNLGYRAAVLTRAADNIPTPERLEGIQLVRRPSPTTTTFRNIYRGGHRQQYVRDVADPIVVGDLPTEWRAARIALLAPVAGEVASELAHVFAPPTSDRASLIGVTPQGWMRQWDETGRVSPRSWSQAQDILPHVRVLVLSEEDLGEHVGLLELYRALTPIVVLTRGAKGCTVYERGREPFDSPAFKATEVDPTGLGDVFTAAFLIRLFETNELADAARFANCTASFALEAEGTAGIPTREMVESRLERGALNL